MDPSSSVLHYCQTVFEGLKAYRDHKGKVTLFRPDMNMKRMIRSAARVALPVSLSFLFVADVYSLEVVLGGRRLNRRSFRNLSSNSSPPTRIGSHKGKDTAFTSDQP